MQIASTNASQTGISLENSAARIAESAKFDPIERSMLPVMTRIAVPTAAMPVTAMLRPITRRLSTVAKFSFLSETIRNQPPSATSRPAFLVRPRMRLASRDGSWVATAAALTA